MKSINIKVYTSNASQIEAIKAFMNAMKIKFELSKTEEKLYNKDFVEKIQKSRKQSIEGKIVKIDLDDIWK